LLKYQNDQYNLFKDGFCFLPSVYTKKEIISAYEGLEKVINGEYNTGRQPERRFWEIGDDPHSIIKIDKPHVCNKSIWSLITKPEFGKALALATNAEKIQVWHSQVVWKPKSKGIRGNAGWHRDAQYWPFWSTDGLFTAWIALSKVSKQSGPVRYIAKSNHWKNLKGLDFFDKDIKHQDILLDRCYKNRNIVNGILDVGQIGIHTSLTYHSSIENKEKNPRVGMVVHFCTEKAQKIIVNDENANYLDQLKDQNTAPVIYKRRH